MTVRPRGATAGTKTGQSPDRQIARAAADVALLAWHQGGGGARSVTGGGAGNVTARGAGNVTASGARSVTCDGAGDVAGNAAGDVALLLARVADCAADFANLGVLWRAAGDPVQAEAAYRQAIAHDPRFVPAPYNLGNLLADTARPAEAAAAFRAAIALQPDHGQAWNGLGLVLQRTGALAEAERAFAQAVRHAADRAEAHVNHGVALFALEQYERSRQAYESALRLQPTHAGALGNLGALLLRAGHAVAAETACRRAIALNPNEHRWHANLAVSLQMQARHTEAETAYRSALRIRPDYAGGHGTLLFALNYRDDLAAEAIFAEFQRWDEVHARPMPRQHAPLPRSCDLTPRNTVGRTASTNWPGGGAMSQLPARRQRVGYVSPDFRQHAVALFAEPLIAAHDRARVELFLYAELAVEDATTARFRTLADHWRPTLGVSDHDLASMIRHDGIDVLIDLGGHTASSRLMVFAHRPAPVQIAYLLGHGTTSGLSAMDLFLADLALVPDGFDHLFAERVHRLDRCPLVYRPPETMPAPAPRDPAAPLTFGHFGRTERLNDTVIAAWSRILHALPDSHLILDNRPFQELAFRAAFADRFAAHGIKPDRVTLRYTTPQEALWTAYADIDIALDPFPHNAGTTTIEALWLGVPVLSLTGRPSVGRFGASILGALGLGDWVAGDVDAYVAKAVAMARDRPALAQLRQELRGRFEASSLRDARGLAARLEDLFDAAIDEAERAQAAVIAVPPLQPDANNAPSPDAEPRPFIAADDAPRPATDAPRPVADKTSRPAVEKALQATPDDALRALFQANDPNTERGATEILATDPDNPTAHHVAGLIAYRTARYTEADHHLTRTRAATPHDPEAHANHAAILRKLGRLAEAEQTARTAIRLAPDRSASHNNLGNILRDSGRFPEAEQAFRDAVRLQPDFADAWANLAWVQSLCGQALESERSARNAIAYDPANPNGHNNLGLALMRQSRLREAEDALREALRLKPDFALAHSNILFCLNYRDDWTAERIFAEYQAWDAHHARPLRPAQDAHDLDRTPGRRLRIGYVSPDFRTHAVALFTEPLLAAHDRDEVELFLYAELAQGDATTERFRANADHWRPTIGMDDAAVADMIRHDRIDILVDLAGHTAGNRLMVFARRPAPVLIEFMLGHGYTSGLSAMDVFLADAALAPPNSAHLFSERVVRLPHIPLAYRPPAGMPEVAPGPVSRNGTVTFGYFGRTVRLNDTVIATWARILHKVPDSRLMLNNGPFAEPAGCDRMRARFAAHGIGAERLILTCTSPQPATWAAYREVDIALDPFPHNAGTTTIEALWMGVPVVTLAGRPTVGRFGASILRTVGLTDWVAEDADAYVALAAQKAADFDALAALRATLRARFAASPLHDAPGLARAIEATYRHLWDDWRIGRNVGQPLPSVTTEPDPADASPDPLPGLDPRPNPLVNPLPNPLADPRALFLSGDRTAAAAAADHLLAEDPTHADALHIKGLLAHLSGNPAAAIAYLAKAPPRADILTDQGVILRTLARHTEAETCYRLALRCTRDFAPALGNLGNLLLDRGDATEAETLFRRAMAQTPDQPWLLRGAALALLAQERPTEAEPLLRRALTVAPDDAEAHETLGALLSQTGRSIEAETHHRAALPSIRDRHRTLGNLAVALQTQGRHEDAEACYRQALTIRPDYASSHGNLLFALNYRHDLTPESIFEEYQEWDRRHAAGLAPRTLPRVVPAAGRRLRVGYVSPDFRQHAVAHFALPLLAAHDRSRIELFLYPELAVPDVVSDRFRALADHWRPTTGLSDEAVAAMIRADGIDVLVDMAGHTGANRLLVFARRPAPVQIETLLGLGTTTGMTAMDAFIADATLAPPGAEALFSENLIRLARIPLSYAPPRGMPNVTARNPGPLTFGYFGRVQRLNPRVIAAWSRILHAVPDSYLVLNSHPFQEAAFCTLYQARFAEHGITPDRLSLIHTTPQATTWAAYGSIDIALDPFPHNAGTTTIEALWMGVPVLTRADRPSVGRFGAAILGAAGLRDWVTADDDAYVARAIAASGDREALSTLRTTLRQRVADSPLCDADGLARAMETAYRDLHARAVAARHPTMAAA